MGKQSRQARKLARLQEQIQQQREDAAVTVHSETRVSTYTGPIPPPEHLRRYDEVVPGAAARILAMAERQNEHRIGLEKIAIHSEIHRANWGVACATIISLAMLVGGVLCVLHGHDWAGGTIATAAMASVVGAFIYGTSQRRKEREAKAREQVTLIRPR